MAKERRVTDLSDWFLDSIDILGKLCYDEEPIGDLMSVANYVNRQLQFQHVLPGLHLAKNVTATAKVKAAATATATA